MKIIFDRLNEVHSKYYVSSEYLTMDAVIILFTGRLNFTQHIPKKHNCFGITIYEFCNMSGSTYDMDMCLGKNRTRAIADMTVTLATVRHSTIEVEEHEHKLYTDNFFHHLTYSGI
jgi:hypothetical protein